MKDLRTLKVDELKDIARGYSIVGAWKKTKDVLIADILKAAELNKQSDLYFDSETTQNEPEEVEEVNEEPIAEESEATQDESEPTQKKQRGKDLIEYDGRTQNLSQWAKELGMPGQTLFARIRLSGWSVEKAFTTPVKTRKKKEEA